MPKALVRAGRAHHQAGHHQAFSDGIFHIYRTGAAVFTRLSFEWTINGKTIWGTAPARVLRFFHFDDDDELDPDERLMVEQAWCWNLIPARAAVHRRAVRSS